MTNGIEKPTKNSWKGPDLLTASLETTWRTNATAGIGTALMENVGHGDTARDRR
jgi:hypothetical protein